MRLISFLLLCAFASWSHAQPFVEISGTGTVRVVDPDHIGLFSVNDTFTARIVYAVPASGFGAGTEYIAGLAIKVEVNGNVFDMSSPLNFADPSLTNALVNTDNTPAANIFSLVLFPGAGNTYSLPPTMPALGPVELALDANNLYVSANYPEQTSDLDLSNLITNAILFANMSGVSSSIFELNPPSIQLRTVSALSGSAPVAAPQTKAVPGSTWWSAMLMMIGLGFLGRKRLASLLP